MKRNLLGIAALVTMLALCGCGASSAPSVSSSDKAKSTASAAPVDDEGIEISTDSGEVVAEEFSAEHSDDFIELGTYQGLSIEAGEDTPIEEGLIVDLNYKTSVKGKEVEGVAANGLEVTIGMKDVVEGFDEALIGHKSGDTFSFDLKVPSDYPDDSISGKTVTYDVDILSVYKTSPDVAFARFLDSCTVKQYPASLIDSWTDLYLDSYKDMVGDGTKTPAKEEVLRAIDMDEQFFDDMVKGTVKEVMAIDSVFAKEQVDRESEEYQALMSAYLEKNGYSSFEDAVSMGMPADYITNAVDEMMLKQILIKYEAK